MKYLKLNFSSKIIAVKNKINCTDYFECQRQTWLSLRKIKRTCEEKKKKIIKCEEDLLRETLNLR